MSQGKDVRVSGRKSAKVARLVAELIGDYARVYVMEFDGFIEDSEVAIWTGDNNLVSLIKMEEHWPDTAMRVFSVVRNCNLDGSRDISTRRGNSPIGAIESPLD